MIFLRSLTARPRLLVSAIVAVAVFPLLPAGERLATRLLLAWDAGVVLNLLLTWTMMARSGVNDLRQRAGDIEDAGAVTILALTITAAVASLGAIAAELRGLHSGTGEGPALRIALAGATILFSWLFVQTTFALHYAHDYYGGPGADRGGLAFPKDSPERDADYWDFLYFAVTIGAASQTSDVTVVSHRTRRYVLAHTILSFLFNTTVLALAINVGASLL
jgi:uncharacterized membrane protein